MSKFDKRLSRLENVDGLRTVCNSIGRWFDELSQPERERWTKYRFNVDAATVAEIERQVNGTLHFCCDKRPQQPSKAEHAKIVSEIEKAVLGGSSNA